MDIEMIALCDAATQSGGKLNVLGAFDRIFAKKFPATHPHCAVAMRVRFVRMEQGRHRIAINVVNADGRPVIPAFTANVNVKCADDEDSTAANMVLNIQALKFEKEGRYSVDVAVDGRHEKSLPLLVRGKVPVKPNLN